MNERRIHWLVWGLIGLGIGYAWLFRHVEDDAFITFRYSKHLVEGIGPVWNADQRVEGYTNFLWMLVMALPIALGLDPVLPAVLISLACLSLNLWLLYRIAARMSSDDRTAIWIWLPVLCSHTLLLFATSGMETALNGLLWTCVFWQMLDILSHPAEISPRSLMSLGLSLTLCILSRPEGALLATVAGIGIWWIYGRRDAPSLKAMFLWFLIPLVCLTFPWLAWKWAYYGSILPNTFYVKTAATSLWGGFKFISLFVFAGGCWIPFALSGFRHASNRSKPIYFERLAWILAGMFLLYVGAAGGDYLEFRLLTPVIPLLLIFSLVRLQRRKHKPMRLILASLAMVMLAFVWGQGHGRLFKIWQMNSLVHQIEVESHALSFAAQGQALGTLFDHDPSIRLAIGACGAIPYYSNCYGIDLYGLNEPIAEFSSYETGYGPGHARLGDFNFLLRKKPHLVSLRCDYLPADSPERAYTYTDPQIAELLKGHQAAARQMDLQVIELPLENDFVEVCIYLNTHPRIEALVKNNSLKIYHLRNN